MGGNARIFARMLRHAVLTGALATTMGPLWAQEKPKQVFRLAERVLEESRIQITHGAIVLSSDWPTLIIAEIDRQTLLGPKQGSCTGTLVGPNVALLAAHCVDDGAIATSVDVVLDAGGVEVPLSCDMHVDYITRPAKIRSPRGQEDYALCMLLYKGNPPPGLQNLRFEVLDYATPLHTGELVLMTGYGCSDLRVIDDEFRYSKADGQLRIEDTQLATGVASATGPAAYVTVRSGEGREPALCPGDSGGPVFTGIQVKDPQRSRRVRAVNSSVDWNRVAQTAGAAPRYEIVSYMAPTGIQLFRTWVDRWLLDKARQHPDHPSPVICGVNSAPGAGSCRP